MLFVVGWTTILSAQTFRRPTVASQNNNIIVEQVDLTPTETIVTLRVPRGGRNATVSFSSATVMIPCNAMDLNYLRGRILEYPKYEVPSGQMALYVRVYKETMARVEEGRKMMSDKGVLIRSLSPDKLDVVYDISAQEHEGYLFKMHFDRLPYGCEEFYIREVKKDGKEWVGIKVSNPNPEVPNLDLTRIDLKGILLSQNDGITGIYEEISGNKFRLACIKVEEIYILVYLGGGSPEGTWKPGDIKAVLRPTATARLFKGEWILANKTPTSDAYFAFDGVSMKSVVAGKESAYLKTFPPAGSSNSESVSKEWSGTGFALNNGYIVTNHHVIEGAREIKIQGINGDFSTLYNAKVVAGDEKNDLAILKVDDARFSGFGKIPYALNTTAEVGEDVFVLGYPLTVTMGYEVKLTTGVVSSLTGFQGDVSLYQISAPIQPGNSGGPLFNKEGNLIGVVSAKHKGAENVSYAIKASYLNELIRSVAPNAALSPTKTQAPSQLTERVKQRKNYVFYISCSR